MERPAFSFIFYADDTILLSSDPIDLQTRFTLIESLAAQIGLTLNRDKTVVLLGKVKHKSTIIGKRGGAGSIKPSIKKVHTKALFLVMASLNQRCTSNSLEHL